VTTGLYIHIPFCRIRCPYCDFNTYTGMNERIPSYVDALVSELTLRCSDPLVHTNRKLRSVYFGGGTPSLLEAEQVKAILSVVKDLFPTQEPLEVTLEANPGTVDRDKLAAFAAAGVTRLTLGVQTFSPELLSGLGRLHSVDESLSAVVDAASCDFSSLNIDLMYGLSGQTEASWADDLRQALTLPVSHLSLYNLTIEEGTPFARSRAQGKLELPEEDSCRTMYIRAMEETERAGFSQYEVSNFAKQGAICQHNRLYWEGESWIGLGAGAHGFTAESGSWGRRWWNLRRPGPYIAALRRGELPEEGEELLDETQARDEFIMLGLRRSEGLNLPLFRERFKLDVLRWDDPTLDNALQDGLLSLEEDHLRASKDGVIIVDYLISRLSASLDRQSRWDRLDRR
jgi:oxygen-independent coproporphyrinogen-3 oxidase